MYVTVTGSETAPQFFALVFFILRGWVIPLAETSIFIFWPSLNSIEVTFNCKYGDVLSTYEYYTFSGLGSPTGCG